MAGSHAVILKAIEVLESEETKARGLYLNPSKCEIIWLNEASARAHEHMVPERFTKRMSEMSSPQYLIALKFWVGFGSS